MSSGNAKAKEVDRLVKPKTAKAKRALLKRAPRVVETLKKALVLQGNKTSQIVKDALTDLATLRKGECVKFSRKNDNMRPFEVGGEVSLEFLARKADCSLFALGSHSKKRPNNLTLGRLFDFHVLDLLELGIENFKSMRSFGAAAARAALGSKPCIVFTGDLFETDAAFRMARSLLLDFFRGRVVPNINLKGLDRVMIFTATPGRILMRQCAVQFKKSGTRLPKVALLEMGPSMDLVVRRSRDAPPDVRREANAAAPKPKKKKNVQDDVVDGKVGRIYLPPQAVDELALSKPKGVKRQRRELAMAEKESRQDAPQKAGLVGGRAPKRLAAEGVGGAGEAGAGAEGGAAGGLSASRAAKKAKRAAGQAQ